MNFGIEFAFSKGPTSVFSESPNPCPGPPYKVCQLCHFVKRPFDYNFYFEYKSRMGFHNNRNFHYEKKKPVEMVYENLTTHKLRLLILSNKFRWE